MVSWRYRLIGPFKNLVSFAITVLYLMVSSVQGQITTPVCGSRICCGTCIARRTEMLFYVKISLSRSFRNSSIWLTWAWIWLQRLKPTVWLILEMLQQLHIQLEVTNTFSSQYYQSVRFALSCLLHCFRIKMFNLCLAYEPADLDDLFC